MTKKHRQHYFDDDVVSKKEKLIALFKKKTEIYNKLGKIHYMYNLPDDWLKRLPANALQELYTSLSKGKDSSINFFELRSKLKREHDEGKMELDKLESEISISQIDLLLAKINCIDKKLTTDGYQQAG